MISFSEFLEVNEELNYRITNELIEFEDRWFYYDSDDEIIYGCDDVPTDCLFSFNPGACKVNCNFNGGESFDYDVNNPICIITLKLDDSNEFAVYSEKSYEYLKDRYHYIGKDVKTDRVILQDKLEEDDEYRTLIMYGKELVASTFDIIEEN